MGIYEQKHGAKMQLWKEQSNLLMPKIDGRTKEGRELKKKLASEKANEDLLQTVRDRYEVMVEADRDNRIWAIEDIRFVNIPGAQWEANMKEERGKRPCYEYHKTRIRAKRIINDTRNNRPQRTVRAVEAGVPEPRTI